ncbi:hypothetical protein BFP72_13530 [Reichenbachiella sp. 5M10]|uniref:hypothetical protein n=1 Tax=Reichenbachiella sp. 5M10 TaxID=1889772 RepID=UPI000C160122|nr:hypothetical protein [Reichenbachiella sp. 5M10]PIB36343.1 hypothetical protein BFP72_13530 [Reichenbachiella sp. 5M10]
MVLCYLRTFTVLLISTLFLIITDAQGQSLENVQVQVDGDDINVSFDLVYKTSLQEKYDIEIYSSRDNYTEPLKIKEGELKDVPALNRRHTFILDGMENFAEFKGEIDFQIIATMVYSPVIIDRPFESQSYKRGRMVEVKWHGGIENETFAVELFKNGVKMETLEENNQYGSYNWAMSSKQKKGKYQFAIQSEKNMQNKVLTPEFKVKSKVPFIVKALPVLAAGAAAYFILNSGGESGGSGGGTESLPNPPALP